MQKEKGNKDLHTAKSNAADEFYTAYGDVEKEMSLYGNYFRDKHVYCPCDNGDESSFYRYFKNNFESLGLSRLTATSLQKQTDDTDEVLSSEEQRAWEILKSRLSDYDGERNGLYYNIYKGSKEERAFLTDTNGDFRSESILPMIIHADIIVTNPPFSLFREFISILTQSNKDFIILGNINAVTYKEVFPHIVNGTIRLGSSIHSGDREFLVPDWYPLDGTATRTDPSTGQKFIRVKGVRWFTNIFPDNSNTSVPVKHTTLTKRFSDNPADYPKFDTYDAINVNSMKEIPYDYTERIGAPITVLDKMNNEGDIEFLDPTGNIITYQIMGMLNSGGKPQFYDYAKPILDGKCKFKRIIIRKK